MHIRKMEDNEIGQGAHLALTNWGAVAADRMVEQAIEGLKGGKYAPKFFVADVGDVRERVGIIGFAAYQRSMRMHGAFDLIWLAVHEQYQGKGVGTALTKFRIEEIKKQHADAVNISLVTQKPEYFGRFGFMRVVHLGNDWVEMVRILKNAGMS
jgi:predicted N-acetyltransferase YhbS